MSFSDFETTAQREEIERAIAALEAQRAVLGDAVVDTMLAAAREKLEALDRVIETTPQRKQVTVLFADVSGFTELSETLDAEEVSDLMNALWARLDGIITSYGGLIDKHIGDAVMALFGAPTAREDDPERAIRAALTMQVELANFNERLRQPNGDSEAKKTDRQETALAPSPISLGMRIGVNTGPVLLGKVGTTAEYTAMGDTVNLASRLEHAAPVGGVLVSHSTYCHVRGLFNVQALEPIRVKGKHEPVQVYLVRGVKPRAFRVPTRGVEGVETRMVGRDAELAHLQEALQTVMRERRARVVTVVGDAGVGKSRLLYEFDNWVELLPAEVYYFKGRSSQLTVNIPHFLTRDLFASRFDIRNSDPAAVAREKLESGILRFMGAGASMQAHFIGHLIGLDFSESVYLRGILDDARQIRDRAFHYVAQFFAAAASPRRPVLILLDDLQWADGDSLDLIEHVARECRKVPLMIVALTRPELFERRRIWAGETSTAESVQQYSRLNLLPLSLQDSQELVENILRKIEDIPISLKQLIVEGAEGNPFFIEELIKMLIDDGVIVKTEGHWYVESDRLAEIKVPSTLVGVLQARLDGLSHAERAVLQRAAVVGHVFWNEAVWHLREDPSVTQQATDALLAALRNKELIFRQGASAFVGQEEYVFKHAMFHEVVYESVLKRHRSQYHALVAEWLIEQGGERVNEYAGLIGGHYEHAGNQEQAAEWYTRAGFQAQQAYAPEAAIDYFKKALFLLPQATSKGKSAQDVRRAELYQGLGLMLRWQARFEEAADAYTAMRQVAETIGDRVIQAAAWEGLSWVQQARGDYRAMMESTERAEEIARAAGIPARAALARALYNKGWALSNLGEAEAALALGEEALRLSSELNARRVMADSMNLLGWVHHTLGHYHQASRCFEQALALFRELNDKMWIGGMLNNLGIVAKSCQDYERAKVLYQEALLIAREVGHRLAEIAVLNNLGGVRLGLGEYEAAESDLRRVVSMAEAVGWGGLSGTYSYLAEAYLGQGNPGEALDAARRAIALSQETGAPDDLGHAWRVMGMVCAAAEMGSIVLDDQPLDAATCFARSLQIYSETGMQGEQARTLEAWARYELAHGDEEKGCRLYAEAQGILERLGVGGSCDEAEQ